ncbi:MAG: hypothetical protein ABW003_22820, partial [Microvirga sp.]
PVLQAFSYLGGIVVDDEGKLIFPQNANFRARFRYDAVFGQWICIPKCNCPSLVSLGNFQGWFGF